jgi:hypothetical protein
VYTIKIKNKEMQAKTLTQFACDLNVPLLALIEWNGGMSHVSSTCKLKRHELLTIPMIGPENPQALPPAVLPVRGQLQLAACNLGYLPEGRRRR